MILGEERFKASFVEPIVDSCSGDAKVAVLPPRCLALAPPCLFGPTIESGITAQVKASFVKLWGATRSLDIRHTLRAFKLVTKGVIIIPHVPKSNLDKNAIPHLDLYNA